MIDAIRNPDRVIINTGKRIRPEALQFYLSRGITLRRTGQQPLIEVDALGRVIQWSIPSEENIAIPEGAEGALISIGIDQGGRTEILRVCFDHDERKVLDFRRNYEAEGRFYLSYRSAEDKKLVDYGAGEYELLISDTLLPSRERAYDAAGFAGPAASEYGGGNSPPQQREGEPYLEIQIANPRSSASPNSPERSRQTPSERTVPGKVIDLGPGREQEASAQPAKDPHTPAGSVKPPTSVRPPSTSASPPPTSASPPPTSASPPAPVGSGAPPTPSAPPAPVGSGAPPRPSAAPAPVSPRARSPQTAPAPSPYVELPEPLLYISE
jgi:hypothetical protein